MERNPILIMANIISLQFNGTIETRVGKLEYTGDPLDNTDIEYWIGTNGYATTYSNINPGQISADSSISNAWTRNTSNDSSGAISSSVDYTYLNYSLLPNYIVLGCSNTSGGSFMNIGINAQNEEPGDWRQIGSINIGSLSGSFTYVAIPLISAFWTQTFQIARLAGSGNLLVHEIFMYGAFKRQNNSTLGLFPANSTVEAVKDSELDINSVIGPLNYQASLTSKPNIITSTSRVTLTGDLEIEGLANDIIITVDPNGSTRNIILPQTPKLDTYLKIISLDGSNVINLRETVGGPIIQEISNASTVLSVECFWEATDGIWHIVS